MPCTIRCSIPSTSLWTGPAGFEAQLVSLIANYFGNWGREHYVRKLAGEIGDKPEVGLLAPNLAFLGELLGLNPCEQAGAKNLLSRAQTALGVALDLWLEQKLEGRAWPMKGELPVHFSLLISVKTLEKPERPVQEELAEEDEWDRDQGPKAGFSYLPLEMAAAAEDQELVVIECDELSTTELLFMLLGNTRLVNAGCILRGADPFTVRVEPGGKSGTITYHHGGGN